MGKNYMDYHKESLNMSSSKANRTLTKILIFNLVKEIGEDKCFRCGYEIESVDDLSYEHKVDWLNSENPYFNFHDLNNITFSHLKCNVENTVKNRPRKVAEMLEKEREMKISSKGWVTDKNGKLRKIPKSGFLGVTFSSTKIGSFNVVVRNKEGKSEYKGNFTDILEAAKCADRAFESLHGKDAFTNKKAGLI